MAAGGPGDHPLTDILRFNLSVYNDKCDNLIREIAKYSSTSKLYSMIQWFETIPSGKKELLEFENKLTETLNDLRESAKDNGWEIK